MTTHSSGLDNPMDRGAWWTAVYGVTQSQTRLKRLSSSSTSNVKFFQIWPFTDTYMAFRVSLMAQSVRNLPAKQETWVWSFGQEGSLEKEMTAFSSVLAWRVPRTEELAGYSLWHHKELEMNEATEKTYLWPSTSKISHHSSPGLSKLTVSWFSYFYSSFPIFHPLPRNYIFFLKHLSDLVTFLLKLFKCLQLHLWCKVLP